MKIAITGSSGFVGKNLIPYLEKRGLEIKVINLRDPHWNLDSFMSADAIIHLAGKAHDVKNVSNGNEYNAVNYELTKKVYDTFLKSNATKFIFVSSVKAVADSVRGEILTEEDLPEPKTDYGKSKLKAEGYIQNHSITPNKFYYIFRPSMIHGPGNKGNLNLLYKFVKSGIPFPLAAYKNKRSFLSIENLCFVFNEFLVQNLSSGIYNIADDEALSTNDVVRLIARSSSKKVRLLKIPIKLVEILASIGDLLCLPLNSERLRKLTESYVVSNQKVKTAIKKQLPLLAREGLLKTTESFKSI